MSGTEVPLHAIDGISPEVISRLQLRWIQTADQLVGLTGSPKTRSALARELDLSETEVDQIVVLAKGALSAQRVAELSRPVDTTKYVRGALPPRNDP